MTDEPTDCTSEDDLRAALGELLRRAHTDSIEVEGGWECRNGSDHPDWDVIVTEVRKADGGD